MEVCTPLSSAIASSCDGFFRKFEKYVRTLKNSASALLSLKPKLAAQSIRGRQHAENQDAVMVRNSSPYRAAVADGISACWKSEIAAQLAVEAFEGCGTMGDSELTNQVILADRQVRELFRKLDCPEDEGGQSTLLVAELKGGNRATLLHVGDSRAYLLTRGFWGGHRARQITRDQTSNGIMYQAIGFGIHKPDELLYRLTLPAASTLLLATDGVFKGMTDPLRELAALADQHCTLESLMHGIVTRGAALCSDDVSVAAIRTADLQGARLECWLALALTAAVATGQLIAG